MDDEFRIKLLETELMGNRDAGQSHRLLFPEHFMLPLHHSPNRRTGQVFMRGVHTGQQAMSAAVYLRGKIAATSWFALDTPGLHPASDPSRQLRSAPVIFSYYVPKASFPNPK